MKSNFFNNIATLSLGAGISQLIPLVFLPLLTRIYSPEQFGVLALYIALVSIIGVVSSGRYEQAIMLPKNDSDALALCKVTMVISLFVSCILLLLVLSLGKEFALFLGNAAIYPWLYFLPISIVITAIIQTYTSWFNRKKLFRTTALVRVVQSSSQSVTQVGVGLLAYPGLIFGQIMGGLVASIVLLKNLKKKNWLVIKGASYKQSKSLMKKYNRFPKYGIFGAISDACAVQMPILIITRFFEATITGYFSLTFRVLSIPATLLSSALSQVFYQKVATAHLEQPDKIAPLVIKIALVLFAIFLPIAFLLACYGDMLFVYFFGKSWQLAGELSQILVYAAGIRFIVSPLSVVMSLGENLKKAVLWQTLYLLTVSSVLIIFSTEDIKQLLIAFVVHELVLYSSYFLLIYFTAVSIGKKTKCAV
ncbi:oligosaccharide flippase family protein [Colwellia psychrerythraea]|uniref:Polysaccharide biosynthesis protein n=1 Tax=Colwellia psychrerythraea TaxID=28229 RepID=A0A099KVA3_COLPS|nr:oligosaccharide flippase family protein [Colwellia psychrerythraea]KGJ93588.1 polysaccharide biosynthesis protein [Colwellia psychrerythraea]